MRVEEGLLLKEYEGRPVYDRTKEILAPYRTEFRDRLLLEPWRDLATQCISCPARREARAPVLSEGPQDARVVVIGRNPGAEEDLNGRPFFPGAPCGQLLGQMFEIVGVRREDVYITNAMFCRTLRDRPPLSGELFQCVVWKVLEWYKLTKVRYVILLGTDAVKQFFGVGFPSIVRCSKDVYLTSVQEKDVLVFPCYHPGYVVRRTDLAPVLAKWCQSVGRIIRRTEETWRS